MNVEKILQ